MRDRRHAVIVLAEGPGHERALPAEFAARTGSST